MDRAESRVITGYFERHHVVPRCLDKSSKLTVRLTPEEHYVAHQLLTRMHPGNRLLVFAAVSMTRVSKNTSFRNNKLYGWLRRRHAQAIGDQLRGRKWSANRRAVHTVWNKGKKVGPLSDQHKTRLGAIHRQRYIDNPELSTNHSKAMKKHYEDRAVPQVHLVKPDMKFKPGQTPWNKGKHWPEEILQKFRGPRSEEARANVAAAVVLREQRRRERKLGAANAA